MNHKINLPMKIIASLSIFYLTFFPSLILAQYNYTLVGCADSLSLPIGGFDPSCSQFSQIVSFTDADSCCKAGGVFVDVFDLTENMDFTIIFKSQGPGEMEGIAFVLQNHGLSNFGGSGGWFGVQNYDTSSLIIEIDTNPDNIDPMLGDSAITFDHIAVSEDGDLKNPIIPPIAINADSSDFNTNTENALRIRWDADNHFFEVFINGRLKLSFERDLINDVFAGDNTVYVGYTASSGAVPNVLYGALCNASGCIDYKVGCDSDNTVDCGTGAFLFDSFGAEVSQPREVAYFNPIGNNLLFVGNGYPQMFVSRMKFNNVKIRFKIKTLGATACGSNDPNWFDDDDWFGFMFGHLAPFGYPYNNYDTWLFDWRREITPNPDNCDLNGGINVSRVNGIIDVGHCDSIGTSDYYFSAHNNGPALEKKDSIYGAGMGWEMDTSYGFEVIYTPSLVRIYIDGDLKFELSDSSECYQTGRFGFYNYSQSCVQFSDFSFELLPQFSTIADTICINEFGQFEYLNDCLETFSAEIIDSLEWDLGDSIIIKSTKSDSSWNNLVSHLYTTPGTKHISLTISQNGCSATYTDSIYVRPSPIVELGNDTTLCAGDALYLDVTLHNIDDVTYNWEDGSTDPTRVITTDTLVWIERKVGYCTQRDSINVNFYSEINILLQTTPSCFDQDNGHVDIIISGGVPPYQIIMGNIDSLLPENNILFQNLFPEDYSLTIIDSTGCEKMEYFTISEFDEPIYNFNVTDISCYGDDNGLIEISPISTGLTFHLANNPNNVNTTFSDLPPGDYNFIITDTHGCDFNDVFEIIEPPLLEIDMEETKELGMGDTFQIVPFVTPFNILNYEWTPPIDINCTDCPTPKVFPLQNTTYRLIVMNGNGCTAEAYIDILLDYEKYLYIPNAFSPNNDAKNDQFMVYAGTQGFRIKKIDRLLIFKREGNLVFEVNNFLPDDPTYGWDGTFKGEPLLPQVFAYFLEVTFINGERVTLKGNLTLVK